MCDLNPNVITAIYDEIEKKVYDGDMFTAFDISLGVKRAMDDKTLRHIHMRKEIHSVLADYIFDGILVKTLKNVVSDKNAWVYHNVSQDPDDYVFAKSNKATPTNVTDSDSDDDSDDDTNKVYVASDLPTGTTVIVTFNAKKIVTVNPDGRGTICIPSKFTSSVGLWSGSRVYVYKDGDELYISNKKDLAGKGLLTSYTVDSYGNVRITSGVLNKVNLKGSSVRVSCDDCLIRISQ